MDYVQTDLGCKQVWPASNFERTLMRESFLKCFADYAAYPNEEWDLSKEEAIYRGRDSRAGLDSLTVLLLSPKNLRGFSA